MRELIDNAPVLSDYLDDESRRHFDTVQNLLSDVGVSFSLNTRLVRGLDYYSRTVFEWITDQLGSQSAVCSGGRYDGLVAELGGRETPAVGWALGLERVVELMRAEDQEPPARQPHVCMVAIGDEPRRRSFGLAETLRREIPGLRVLLVQSASGLKAQLKRADRSGARFALITGADELAGDQVSLKDLRQDQGQQTIATNDLVVTLRGALEPLE